MKDDPRTNDQGAKLEWVAPAITEWDVVAETQAGAAVGGDAGSYS